MVPYACPSRRSDEFSVRSQQDKLQDVHDTAYGVPIHWYNFTHGRVFLRYTDRWSHLRVLIRCGVGPVYAANVTESENPRKYWNNIKMRLKENQLSSKWGQLKMRSAAIRIFSARPQA
jgi:hypothetical protein